MPFPLRLLAILGVQALDYHASANRSSEMSSPSQTRHAVGQEGKRVLKFLVQNHVSWDHTVHNRQHSCIHIFKLMLVSTGSHFSELCFNVPPVNVLIHLGGSSGSHLMAYCTSHG
jgi:hypothetical protein